ncbi:MAG: hypothetical protein WAN48_12225 [Actinomycetes bacterium]
MTARVILAIPSRVDEASVIAGLRESGGVAELGRRCVDLPDVLAAAAAGAGDVVVIASSVRRLDRDAVDRLTRCGVDVVVVHDVSHQGSLDDDVWTSWGVRAVVPPDSDAVLRAITSRVPMPPTSTPDGASVGEDAEHRPPTGQLVAVWGPTGAPGRTTVAVNVADRLASLGHDTLLADVDTYGASVAQVLGLLDDTSGIASVARLAAGGRLDATACDRASAGLPSGLKVLTGMARPERWPELRAASLQSVWSLAVAHHAFVVLDCGFGIGAGSLSAWPLEVGPPERDEATVASLAMSDVVLAVGSADPVGLVRLVRALPEVLDRAPAARIQVVVNQCRRSAVGRDPDAAVASVLRPRLAELAEQFGPRVCAEVHLVPFDRAALDASMLAGRTLGETASQSPAAVALHSLAALVAPQPAVSRRRRRGFRRSA